VLIFSAAFDARSAVVHVPLVLYGISVIYKPQKQNLFMLNQNKLTKSVIGIDILIDLHD
jgi:hypothetical protein